MEYYELYSDSVKRLRILKEYILKLEAERDYYQQASHFAGVPNTPRPKEVDQLQED